MTKKCIYYWYLHQIEVDLHLFIRYSIIIPFTKLIESNSQVNHFRHFIFYRSEWFLTFDWDNVKFSIFWLAKPFLVPWNDTWSQFSTTNKLRYKYIRSTIESWHISTRTNQKEEVSLCRLPISYALTIYSFLPPQWISSSILPNLFSLFIYSTCPYRFS